MKNLFIRIQSIILVFALLISALLFVGCTYTGYNGDNPELYTVAWKNIPNINGFISNGEVLYDAEVEILETDKYGRILFSYSEDLYGDSAHILIMQHSDSERAYYYPDDCYVYTKLFSSLDLNSKEIIELKQLNGWNEPLDESQCESTAIVRKKPEGKIKVNNNYFEQIVREYHENSDRYVHPKNISFVRFFEFFDSDDYGRELYVVYTDFDEYTAKTEIAYSFIFLVVVNPDKSYDPSTVVIIEDPTNPRGEVKQIKLQNGWNTPR